MATSASANDNLTTCPICLELYDNPKSLPCLHAFCLKCLQLQFRNELPGDDASCPQCREGFKIPQGGVDALRHYFIVQQLVDKEKERIQLREIFCDEHNDREVEMYCYECKKNTCLMCFVVHHRDHNSRLIPEAADSFRLRINEDVEEFQSTVSSVREQTELDVTKFRSKVEDVKRKVLATGDVVKLPVDSQINDVLMELQSVMSESDKQAESVQEAYQLALESFRAHSRELLEKDRPSDITRAACELHDRATELLNNDVTAVKYRPPDVTFTPADVTQVKRLNLIGKLTVRPHDEPGMSCLLMSCHVIMSMSLSCRFM